MTNAIHLTGNEAADALLTEDDNALLIGMLLDQQVPMEKAFSGPYVIAERMGGRLDPRTIAAMSEDDFVALCSERPAIHRFPGSMAKRVRQLCQLLADEYDGAASNIWVDLDSGAELKKRLQKLPGFGADKAAIFAALLGKQRGVTPPGWQEAAGAFGEPGVFRSVADIVDEESLTRVRSFKKEMKAAAKAKATA